MTKKRLSRDTGVTFSSYEDLFNKFLLQMDELLKHQVVVTNIVDVMHARLAPIPFVTAITDDCIETGKEVMAGGRPKYNTDGIQAVGLAGYP